MLVRKLAPRALVCIENGSARTRGMVNKLDLLTRVAACQAEFSIQRAIARELQEQVETLKRRLGR